MALKQKFKRLTKTKLMETSKKLAILILVVNLIDEQLIVLAPYFGVECPEVIGEAIITSIEAVFLGYCLKALFGKMGEESTKLKRESMHISDDLSEEKEGEPNELGIGI